MVRDGKKVINLTKTTIDVTGSSNSNGGNANYQDAMRASRRDQHERQLENYRLRRGANNAGASHWNNAPPRAPAIDAAGPSTRPRVPRRTGILDLPAELQADIVARLSAQDQLRYISTMNSETRQRWWPHVYANRLRYLMHIVARGHTVELYVPECIEITPEVTQFHRSNSSEQQLSVVVGTTVRWLTSGRIERPNDPAALRALLEALCVAHRDFMMIVRARPNGRGVIWQGRMHQLARYSFDAARLDRFLRAAPRDDGHYVSQWWGHNYDYIDDAWNILDFSDFDSLTDSNTNVNNEYRPSESPESSP